MEKQEHVQSTDIISTMSDNADIQSLLWCDLLSIANFHILIELGKNIGCQLFGTWPFCYSWIGYQQVNGSPKALSV